METIHMIFMVWYFDAGINSFWEKQSFIFLRMTLEAGWWDLETRFCPSSEADIESCPENSCSEGYEQ